VVLRENRLLKRLTEKLTRPALWALVRTSSYLTGASSINGTIFIHKNLRISIIWQTAGFNHIGFALDGKNIKTNLADTCCLINLPLSNDCRMISFQVFNLLDKHEQADVLSEDGVYLHTRQEPEFIIDLYQLNGFFVEVYYHSQQQQLMIVKSFLPHEERSATSTERGCLKVAWKKPRVLPADRGFA
jgi:hypothetical protein